GIEPDTLVGVCLDRSIEMLVAILGILKAGGAYLPIEPAYPQERVTFMLEDANVPLVLTTTQIANQLSINTRTLCLDSEQHLANESWENPPHSATAENLAYCIYTSGSTGKPKGTLIEHRHVVNYLTWAVEAYRVAEGSGAPVNTSISFDATVTSLFTPLLVGKKVILLPQENELEALSDLLQSGEPL
ncbi:MAG: AMP-binding protein, partial [Anaerolineales bacterium]|nr:AMP-binding protein [Anaerolineales bacterium]